MAETLAGFRGPSAGRPQSPLLWAALWLGLWVASAAAGAPNAKRLVEQKPITSSECNYELITSFGFKGLVTPSTYRMAACPDIKRSCCRVSDQLGMIENWEINYERIELEERLESYRTVYTQVLETAVDVEQRAEYMMSRLKNKMFSNCRVLATKVAEYKIKKVAEKLLADMDEMEAFVVNSYKGFYCSLCDADHQKSFQTGPQKIVFSRKFCRQMTAKFFPFLLYFHVHMVKYVNLLLRFLTYCDGRGRFSNAAIDPDYLMKIDRTWRGVLEGCRDNRNKPAWFEKCLPICMDFNMLRFPQVLVPQFDKYKRSVELLKDLVRKFELPPVEEEDLEDDTRPEGTFRMTPHKKSIDRARAAKANTLFKKVMDKGANKTAEEKPKKTKFGSEFVIKSQSIVSLNLETFTNEFLGGRQRGFNPYEIGRQAQLSIDDFSRIKLTVEPEVVKNWDGGFEVTYPRIDEMEAAKRGGQPAALPGAPGAQPGAKPVVKSNRSLVGSASLTGALSALLCAFLALWPALH